MSDRRTVSEWGPEEQREEVGTKTVGDFVEGAGIGLWPILVLAAIFVAVIVWAVIHYS